MNKLSNFYFQILKSTIKNNLFAAKEDNEFVRYVK